MDGGRRKSEETPGVCVVVWGEWLEGERGFEKRLRKPSRNWCSLALPAVVAATEVKTAYRAEMLIHTCVVMSVVWRREVD